LVVHEELTNKMPRTKKRFIDKNNAITFCLVHRSQRDPLVADESAPQKVLLPLARKEDRPKVDVSKRREQQRKFGVFFDDDYNYLQHLKESTDVTVWDPVINNRMKKDEPSNTKELSLPSSVFPSEVEESIGMLNKAAPIRGPQLDWDPDIVAGLEEDFNYEDPENALEDDFIELANAAPSDDEGEYELDQRRRESIGSDEGECSDEDGDKMFMDEETKSRFTSYSLTSSVIRRTEGLTLLDDRFEKFYEQYDDDAIGALDEENIEGFMDPNGDLMENILAEYKAKKDKERIKEVPVDSEVPTRIDGEDSSEGDLEDMVVEDEPQVKWDCESILSTYSNIYNHPRLIKEPSKLDRIVVSEKFGIPKHVLGNNKLTERNLDNLNFETESQVSMRNAPPSVRDKSETPEERRNRKLAVREFRKERRIEKKANTTAFKEEKKIQEKSMMNIQRNMQGLKLM